MKYTKGDKVILTRAHDSNRDPSMSPYKWINKMNRRIDQVSIVRDCCNNFLRIEGDSCAYPTYLFISAKEQTYEIF